METNYDKNQIFYGSSRNKKKGAFCGFILLDLVCLLRTRYSKTSLSPKQNDQFIIKRKRDDAVEECFPEHALESSRMHPHTAQCSCLLSQANPPSRFETAPASHRPQGKAFIWRASRILDTYGAETDLRNKLSSNNQIIHVSESNNGGMQADPSGSSPSGTPLCALGVPVDKGLVQSALQLNIKHRLSIITAN